MRSDGTPGNPDGGDDVTLHRRFVSPCKLLRRRPTPASGYAWGLVLDTCWRRVPVLHGDYDHDTLRSGRRVSLMPNWGELILSHEARKNFCHSSLISVITPRLVVVCCKCKYRADDCLWLLFHSSVKCITYFCRAQIGARRHKAERPQYYTKDDSLHCIMCVCESSAEPTDASQFSALCSVGPQHGGAAD